MYRFIHAGEFINQLKNVRILNLQGSMGTGKTLFSVAISYEMLNQGRVKAACFNFPVGFAGQPAARHTMATVDEAGTIFDSRMAWKSKDLNKDSAALTWRLRKLGSYLVIPSFLEVDKRFRVGVRCWRTWALGNRFWIYHWEVGEEDSEERREGINFWQGWLGLLGPNHFFNVFDTFFFPGENLTRDYLKQLLLPVEQKVPENVVLGGV